LKRAAEAGGHVPVRHIPLEQTGADRTEDYLEQIRGIAEGDELDAGAVELGIVGVDDRITVAVRLRVVGRAV
jgi:hypothetical protein